MYIDYVELLSDHTCNGNGFLKLPNEMLKKVDYFMIRRALMRRYPMAVNAEIDYMIDCLYGERIIHTHVI